MIIKIRKGKRMATTSRTGVLIGALLLLAPGARAEEPASRARIEELERQQQRMSEELEELRKAVEKPPADGGKVEEVERRQGILTEEVRRLREALVLPESKELKSVYGLGPAASKVYGLERGLSLGGYGEAHLKKVVSDKGSAKDEFDFLRLVLYVGYKFNDWIVFNSETEFEHASTGESGEVSVEFANLDFLLHPAANVRGGLLLVPVGFLNEIHEPPFFHGNDRPLVERQILPSTWRANGFGLFGEILPGLQYRTYGLTSLDAKGFRSSGIRGGRQSGSRETAEDFSWVGRLDYTLLPGTLIGGSAYLGEQGQNQSYGGTEADVFMQLYELHAQVRTHGLELRALGAVIDLDDARALSADPDVKQAIADVMLGWYGEIAYDVMPLLLPDTNQYLAPWFRYERFDTQSSVPLGLAANDAQDREAWEFGLSYKPIPQVVLKADYRMTDAEGASVADELRLGGGFIF
jgi:hypothetical protein